MENQDTLLSFFDKLLNKKNSFTKKEVTLYFNDLKSALKDFDSHVKSNEKFSEMFKEVKSEKFQEWLDEESLDNFLKENSYRQKDYKRIVPHSKLTGILLAHHRDELKKFAKFKKIVSKRFIG